MFTISILRSGNHLARMNERIGNFTQRVGHNIETFLDEYLPWIKSFHAKFWEITEEGEEYSIDYGRIFTRLNRLGFDGYVCSEYEGQRFVIPGEPIKDLEQVGLHQDLMSRHIDDGK